MKSGDFVVHDEFAYVRRPSSLGEPISAVIRPDSMYKARYANATVIWDQYRLRFFILTDDHQYEVREDRGWGRPYEKHPEYYVESLRRKVKAFARVNKPPYGGIAVMWHNSPQDWKWLGGLDWHCTYTGGQAGWQEFDHGIIIGPFLLDEVGNGAHLLVLVGDPLIGGKGSWEQVSWTGCGEPQT